MKIVALSLALLMSVSGSGAYYIHYCCHQCQEQGVMAVLEEGCDEVHNCQSCATADSCFANETAELHNHDHHGACTVEHVAFDLENITHEQLASIALLSAIVSTSLTDEECADRQTGVPLSTPFLYSGRDYLALYSVLLI